MQQEGEEKEFVCYKKTLRFLPLVLIVYFAAGGRVVMSKQAISDPESLEIATGSSRQASLCSEQKIKNPWRSLSKLLSCASSSAWTIRSCVLHVTISCVLYCHAESVSEATSKAFLRDNCRSSLIPGSVNLELISSASSRSLVWRRSLKMKPYRAVRKCSLLFQNSLQHGIRRTYAQAFFIHCKACCMAIQSWDSSASHNILKSQHLHHQTCFRCAPWELGNCNNIMAIASSHEKSP